MPEAISDTGPILHLFEVGHLTALSNVSPLVLPPLVLAELSSRGIESRNLTEEGIEHRVAEIDPQEWGAVLHEVDPPQIQPADAQVFVLARSAGFRTLVLTDDLALRRMLEQQGASVVGSVGLLIRAYTSGKTDRGRLEESIEALLNASTLHLSRPFRTYIRKLVTELP